MPDSYTSAAMHAALQFVIASDIPAQHKAILIDTLTQALRDQETAERQRQAAGVASSRWQEHETTQLQSYLQGKIANSWQHADESAMHLAAQLHRSAQDIRSKATELGFGPAVDFRLAKALPRPEDD